MLRDLVIGREFLLEESQPGGRAGAVVSYGFWISREVFPALERAIRGVTLHYVAILIHDSPF